MADSVSGIASETCLEVRVSKGRAEAPASLNQDTRGNELRQSSVSRVIPLKFCVSPVCPDFG